MFTEGITIQTREYRESKYTTDDSWVGNKLAQSGLMRHGQTYFHDTKTVWFGKKMDFEFQDYSTGGRGNEADVMTYEEYTATIKKDLVFLYFWSDAYAKPEHHRIPDSCLLQLGDGKSLGNRVLTKKDFVTQNDCAPRTNRERDIVFAGLKKNKNKPVEPVVELK